MPVLSKQPRNALCLCGSQIKAKKCCLIAKRYLPPDLGADSSPPSDRIQICIETLKELLKDFKFIHITNTLNRHTYRSYQLFNANKKTIMIAEKTPENEDVFSSRVGNPDVDIIMLYNGYYVITQYEKFGDSLFRVMEMAGI